VDLIKPECVSVGNYVLTGGEMPAMVIIDAVARLLPDVLGNDASSLDESFTDGQYEYPQYTRPAEYMGHSVPGVLLSGNHAKVAEWRHENRVKHE